MLTIRSDVYDAESDSESSASLRGEGEAGGGQGGSQPLANSHSGIMIDTDDDLEPANLPGPGWVIATSGRFRHSEWYACDTHT